MDTRSKSNMTLPLINAAILDGIRKVKRTHSDSYLRAGRTGQGPKMIFSSKNIRTSFNRNKNERPVVRKTLSGDTSLSSIIGTDEDVDVSSTSALGNHLNNIPDTDVNGNDTQISQDSNVVSTSNADIESNSEASAEAVSKMSIASTPSASPEASIAESDIISYDLTTMKESALQEQQTPPTSQRYEYPGQASSTHEISPFDFDIHVHNGSTESAALPDDFSPPTSPVRTSSKKGTEKRVLSVKKLDSADYTASMGGTHSAAHLDTSFENNNRRQLTQAESPPELPPADSSDLIDMDDSQQKESVKDETFSESDGSVANRSEDEVLKYFNQTVIGETTLSSESSQEEKLPPLSLPQEDYFATHQIDSPVESKQPDSPVQSKVDNSLSPTTREVIKWNERMKTTRAAIKPGTVDELTQLYKKLGEDDFKPSVVKKKRKDLYLYKVARGQQRKFYKQVVDVFGEEESIDNTQQSRSSVQSTPVSPTYAENKLKSIELVTMPERGTSQLAVPTPKAGLDLDETKDDEKHGSYTLSGSSSFRDADTWSNSENDETNPYSKARITAFLKKRLEFIQKKHRYSFEEDKKKDERSVSTSKMTDSNALPGEADDRVLQTPEAHELENSISEPVRDERVIDSFNVEKPGELAGSNEETSLVDHVTTVSSQQDVSSASVSLTNFESKQDGESSLQSSEEMKDVVLRSGHGEREIHRSSHGSGHGEREIHRSSQGSSFDGGYRIYTGNNESFEGERSVSMRSSYASGTTGQVNMPMFTNGVTSSMSEYTANMASGESQSYDLQNRGQSHMTELSRSTSQSSAPRDITEETTTGVYVVEDNVGDFYVVEDVTDKKQDSTTMETTTTFLAHGGAGNVSNMNTTQSSVQSFDFVGPNSSQIAVDSSNVNYGKAREVISALLDTMQERNFQQAVTDYQTTDRNIVVADYHTDAVDRGSAVFSEANVAANGGLDILANQAGTHTAVTMKTEDTDMALNENVYQKTILNIVTDGADRPLWTEQTTDTQVKAWMENGESEQITSTSGYNSQAVDMNANRDVGMVISPSSDYNVTDNQVVPYTVSLPDSSIAESSHVAASEAEETTTGVTVTTTTSTVIGKKVDLHVELPEQRETAVTRRISSLRSESLNSHDRSLLTNGYQSDSSQSDEETRKRASYSMRQVQSSSLDRTDSSRSEGKTRYITRIESIPKSDRPRIQHDQYTYSEPYTTRIDNMYSSFGDADSQYSSQTSKATSSSPGDDSPRYRVVTSPPHFDTTETNTIYSDTPTHSEYYEHRSYRDEESVNKGRDLWRVNSPVKSTPESSLHNEIVYKSRGRDTRDSNRYRVSKTISAEQLFGGSDRQDSFHRSRDSFGSSGKKRYKSFTTFDVKGDRYSPPRKRKSEATDNHTSDTLYRVSTFKKDALPRSREPVIENSDQIYRVRSVSPSRQSTKAINRASNRSLFRLDKEIALSDEEPENKPYYKVGKTRSTEDLVVSRKLSTKTDRKGTNYRIRRTSPARFDSGYFDESFSRREASPTHTSFSRREASPTHTTIIKLDDDRGRSRSVDYSTQNNSLYKVVSVKSNEDLTDRNMFRTSRKTRPDYDSSDSDDGRKGKYRVMSSKYRRSSPERGYTSSPETERRSRKDQTKYYVSRAMSPSRGLDEGAPVLLRNVRSLSPQPHNNWTPKKTQFKTNSTDINRIHSMNYDSEYRSRSFNTSPPRESKNYVGLTSMEDSRRYIDRADSYKYKTDKQYYVRSTSPSPIKTNGFLSRSFSNDQTADSGTGTEVASSDNEGNGEYRESKFRRVEDTFYTVRQEPILSDIPVDSEDLKVERGKILIRNKIDSSKDEDDFDDNLNVFDEQFHLQKDNPLYQSDPDIYKRLEEEEEEQAAFQSQVNQDITFDTVDNIAHRYKGSRQVQMSPQPVQKQNLSTLLLSRLANIDSKDIRQNIDVEHHNEEIYGDLDFVHADGSLHQSGNTDNFDAVNEKVNLTLREGKAFVIIKVIAERIVPIDYEFSVWRKSSAIVTRQIEIDLLANEQRRRLYEHVMENAGARGAITDGAYGPHSMTSSAFSSEKELSSMDTLKLFSQILSVTEGQGYHDDTQYSTRQVQGRLSSTGAHDILY